jgi:hypothetical protein
VEVSASWGVVFGALITLATTIIVQGFTHGFQSRRERQAREATLQAEKRERRAAFQRDTLLAVQDAIELLGRVTARDYERLRAEDAWDERNRVLSEEFWNAAARLTKLIARVFDDDLRRLLRQIRLEATLIVNARSFKDASEAYSRAHDVTREFNDKVAPVLRELF